MTHHAVIGQFDFRLLLLGSTAENCFRGSAVQVDSGKVVVLKDNEQGLTRGSLAEGSCVEVHCLRVLGMLDGLP